MSQLPKPCSDAEASISDSHDSKRVQNLEPSPWCPFKEKERKGRKRVEERMEIMVLFLRLTIMFTDTSIKSSETLYIGFLKLISLS